MTTNNEKDTVSVRPSTHLLAGASGGIVAAIVTSPLDVLRTRLQSDCFHPPILSSQARAATVSIHAPFLQHIRNNITIVTSIRHTEGWRGFFRGLGPILVGVVPATAVKFWVYGSCKSLAWGDSPALIHAQAAIAAGIATATATNPIWVVKTRLQLETRQYRNSFDCARQILRTEGLRGLYRGLSASYLGSIETVLHLVIYERLKVQYSQSLKDTSRTGRKVSELTHWLSTTGAAASAKLAAILIAYPHEVVRTRLRQVPSQTGGAIQYTGLWQTFQIIAKREGLAGLYGGILPHMARSLPSAVLTLGVYEFVLRNAASTGQCVR